MSVREEGMSKLVDKVMPSGQRSLPEGVRKSKRWKNLSHTETSQLWIITQIWRKWAAIDANQWGIIKWKRGDQSPRGGYTGSRRWSSTPFCYPSWEGRSCQTAWKVQNAHRDRNQVALQRRTWQAVYQAWWPRSIPSAKTHTGSVQPWYDVMRLSFPLMQKVELQPQHEKRPKKLRRRGIQKTPH